MRTWRMMALAALAAAAIAGESYAVVGVADADRVVLNYRGLAVTVGLAHIEVPEAQRAKARDRVRELTRAKKAEVHYLPDFGVDDAGAARVHLTVDNADVAEVLVAKGLAKYVPGAKRAAKFEDPLKKAQEQAQKGKLGLWAAGGEGARVEAATPATPATPAPVAAAPVPAAPAAPAAKGPFCSELDSPFYQASGDAAAAAIPVGRVIFYKDEATAKKAGKRLREAAAADLPTGEDEASADAIFAKGKGVYAEAIAAGNSSKRDDLYEQSFQILSKAMTIYGALVDQRPDDEALGEKLRECMQLRYGSMKQRRAH
ncbi:MAG TPA: thermonuclease family protein [Planctomycetota bacterium]|nr:thermonuclease family protein [Planctomycetota bacterium]